MLGGGRSVQGLGFEGSPIDGLPSMKPNLMTSTEDLPEEIAELQGQQTLSRFSESWHPQLRKSILQYSTLKLISLGFNNEYLEAHRTS